MKKGLLSLALVLAMCLSLAIPALADGDKGDTSVSVTDNTGLVMVFELSNPILGVETVENTYGKIKTYQIPYGTVITASVPNSIKDEVRFLLEDNHVVDFIFEIEADGWCQIGYLGEVQQPLSEDLYMLECSHQWPTGTPGPGANAGGVDGTCEYVGFRVVAAQSEEFAASEKPAESEKPVESVVPSQPGFIDVSADSPFAAAIDWAVAEKIAAGYNDGTFRPGSTCMVSHILIFLWRANGREGAEDSSTEEFAATKWAASVNLGLQDSNLLREHCTRALAVTFLWKAAGSPEVKTEKAFTDVAADAEYAEAVAWAVESGITAGTGDGTTFSPDATCTRGQIATFLYRAYQK